MPPSYEKLRNNLKVSAESLGLSENTPLSWMSAWMLRTHDRIRIWIELVGQPIQNLHAKSSVGLGLPT